jgi:hypothetical protein
VSGIGVKTAHPTEFDPADMTHPHLQMLLGRAKIDDLSHQAAEIRLAWTARAAGRAPQPVTGGFAHDSVTLRPCRAEDRLPLAHLAALDGRESPSGPVLVAEIGGQLRAALSLMDGAVVADPFHPTAALEALLRAYSRQPALRSAASTAGEC